MTAKIPTTAVLFAFLLAACGGASADGTPEACEIRVDGQCYADATEACAAASCPMESCTILESYPGQVQCADDSAAPVEGGDQSVASTDPAAEGSPCDADTTCADGLFCIGEAGCDVAWTCQPLRPCTRDLVTYCGCDGTTFEGSGSCPSRPYSSNGPCPEG